ncbi:MAG: potassium-transporting ATPase subunit KdpB, partial [Pseudonocardia sp.]|nr:potassium-transporting ATPase subunit KdpB [Pseudonocardia sp.]
MSAPTTQRRLRTPGEARHVHAERTGRAVGAGAFSPRQLLTSFPGALRKLDPRTQLRNPVMFVVWVGSVLVTIQAIVQPSLFAWLIAVWLWLTVIFANLAEAVAEGRGKAQADTLRRTKKETVAHRVVGPHDQTEEVPGTELRVGDRVVVVAGQVIPGDGDIVEGIATVDESAITGESAPVIRESGGDRSAVTGGTTVLSDRIVVEITTKPGESFVDRMIALVEGAQRQKTPNEIALTILLAALTIIFLLAVVALQPMAGYAGAPQSLIVLTALLVCLIPTTIGALLSAIGIAGMDRLVQRNVLAKSGRAVEAAGDVDTLLLDKTGTITYGNRQATSLIPVRGVTVAELADAARLSSLADQTPEGRSIVELCAREHGLAAEATAEEAVAEFVPFTAQTRMSGLDVNGRRVRKGAASAVTAWATRHCAEVPGEIDVVVDEISEDGGTPLVVAQTNGAGTRVLG